MSDLWIHDVEVDGRRCDVAVADGVVADVRPRSGPHGPSGSHDVDGLEGVDGTGGALIPGLHDHHLHLLAMASAAESVDCSRGVVHDLDGLAAALRNAPAQPEWIRGVGYHESVAGDLDRHRLDLLVPDRPVRLQHRSGALWMLNTPALVRVAAALDGSTDVERAPDGAPTGRLWRYDDRLRAALPPAPPSLAPIGQQLAGYGVTGVTDATPELDPTGLRILTDAVTSGDLPQRLTLLGAPLDEPLPAGIAAGPRKLHLRDHELPTFDELVAVIEATHAAGRAVAIHCVTRLSLLLSLAALQTVGARPGDRIEHAAVVPPEQRAQLRDLGLRVVTQPDFLRMRGRDYLRDVDAADLPLLYPYASLLAAGVPTCASSDAPYGSADPWQVIASAVARSTDDGAVLGADERVDAAAALAGYLSDPADPGGAPRRVRVGAAADLVLLDRPLGRALAQPSADHVAAVWIAGRRVR